MGKVTNLRQKRKQNARRDKRKAADENAVRHGLTKAQKDLQHAQAAQAARVLDGHRRDG